MNLKTRVAAMATAAIFTVSAAGGALAADPQVTQEITGGEFTYSLSSAEMTAIDFDYGRQNAVTTDGTLNLTVTDARGTKQGWTVSIQSSAFIYDGAGNGGAANNISASAFSVEPDAPNQVQGEGLAGVTEMLGGSLDASVPVINATAGAGSGEYTQELPVKLVVPATAPAGTYTATITVSTSVAPGQQG